MAGIKDVAERAGLSVATVSRALSGKGNVSPASRARAQAAAADLAFNHEYPRFADSGPRDSALLFLRFDHFKSIDLVDGRPVIGNYI